MRRYIEKKIQYIDSHTDWLLSQKPNKKTFSTIDKLQNERNILELALSVYLMEQRCTVQDKYNFPKKLYIIGAGPSLQILYDNIEKCKRFGPWAEMRSDVSQEILDEIIAYNLYNVRYSIRYSEHQLKDNLYGDVINYLNHDIGPREGPWTRDGNSLAIFLYEFYRHGGEEVVLFGFDADGSGYWKAHDKNNKFNGGQVVADTGFFNSEVIPSLGNLKISHVGKTKLNVNEITIDQAFYK